MKCLQIHKMRESTSFHISEEKYMTRISFDWTSRPPVWQLIYVCILGLSALIIWYQYVARPPPYLRMFSSWKMVTINTTDLNSAPTKTAVFIKFLIKIAFLPFSLDDLRQEQTGDILRVFPQRLLSGHHVPVDSFQWAQRPQHPAGLGPTYALPNTWRENYHLLLWNSWWKQCCNSGILPVTGSSVSGISDVCDILIVRRERAHHC